MSVCERESVRERESSREMRLERLSISAVSAQKLFCSHYSKLLCLVRRNLVLITKAIGHFPGKTHAVHLTHADLV